MPEQTQGNRPSEPVVPDPRGVPTKCVACHKDLHSPVVCDYCHTLNPINGPTDYFQLLGVERRYQQDENELRTKYLALNRHSHPDFHTGDSEAVRELSMQISSALNNAYRTLQEPVGRAEYLVELLGGRSSAQEKSVPEGFLDEVLALREEVESAELEDDAPKLASLRKALTHRLAVMTEGLGELFSEFDGTVPCEATRMDTLGRIRRQLNAISYVRRLLSQMKK